MVSQLKITIDGDCKSEYHDKKLKSIREQLANLDADAIRQGVIDIANRDIEYHTREHKKEIEGCEGANKWITDLIESLK